MSARRRWPAWVLLPLGPALPAPLLPAQVDRLLVERRQAVAGPDIAYQRLDGTVRFALDPDNPRNARIVDLAAAPRDERGRVLARANFTVLQPVDVERRAPIAVLEVSNRGGRALLRYFQRAAGGDDVGDGLLMRRGLTLIQVGWQCDVPPGGDRLRLEVPELPSLRGLVRCDWVVDRPARELTLGHRGHLPYPVDDAASDAHVLTRRSGRTAPREPVDRGAWRFGDEARSIVAADRFEAGYVYELVYRAVGARVVGLGLAAVRDMASYARYHPDCPFHVEHVVAVGISQTGRFLRHALYQGFTTDAAGRQAFDGALVLTAGAGRGSFNHRFAQPSRDAHRYSAFFYPTDLFPFTSRLQEDPHTGRFDGLLARQHDPDHVPKVFLVNTGYEYWGRAAALVHVDVRGEHDVAPTARERIYHVAGAQHYPVPPRELDGGRHSNSIDLLAVYRALLVALLEWVADGREPPPSQVPTLAAGTLVAIPDLRVPSIGVRWPATAHEAYRADYGPQWSLGIATLQPPRLSPPFPVLVPQVDADGNELGGLRPLELRVPVATYLPWSLREDGEIADFVGAAVPFPAARLAERYGDAAGYRQRLQDAAERMVAQRWLLPEDADALVRRAERLWR